GGATIAETQGRLTRPLGYTTVQTRLNRLVTKGVVVRTAERPARYVASVSPEEVGRDVLSLLVERVTQGGVVPLVAELLRARTLGPEEVRQLRRLLDQLESKGEVGRSK
ncbi:MAG: BlaI/MecI/CopY family transcriptional regulator, partial [Thermoguttaceae bacterium]|nr:BlaI/MecI/CopY family transcriptional regulator [Thermoguttaceae bacterium]